MTKFLFSVVAFLLLITGCRLSANDRTPSAEREVVKSEQPSADAPSYEGLERPVGGLRGKELHHVGYVSSFNALTMQPNWVAWELLADETSGSVERYKTFMPDPQLPQSMQVVHADYTNSGYDRGHMCPAADMKWSSDAMRECFYMTNICPQAPRLNQNYWERLESACRRWARCEGRVYVCCGPVFADFRKSPKIGRDHKVCVPDGFFKVVLSVRPGAEKAIGFYYDNTDSPQTMEQAARTVDQIEQLTGMDFFSALPDDLEERLESTLTPLSDWH